VTVRAPKGRVAGEAFAEELVALGSRRFAEALAPDADRVFAALERAESFEELAAAVDALHARMSPKKAGTVLAKSVILAELAGKASIVEDLESD